MLAGDLAFLAFGPSDFQLHLYGPYISICATCELGYSVTAVWPKQLTVTAQEYFTKRTLGQRKTKRERQSWRVAWEESSSLLSSNFNDSRRCLLFFQSISIKLGHRLPAEGAASAYHLHGNYTLLALYHSLFLSLSVPPASTKCQLYKFKLNHSIVKQCAAHTRSQQRVKLYNLILPFSSFSFPFSFGWGKNWSKNKTSAPLNSFRRF